MRCLAAAGIRQFLDIGSGIPTQGNVHEVAQQAAPGARVVYTDLDPVAIAHSKVLLDGNPDADIINADLREPEKILAHPTTRQLIDFSQPTGLLLAMVLHFIPDADDPWRIVATLRDALAPGSFIVLSHVENKSRPEKAQAAERSITAAWPPACNCARGPKFCVSSTDSSCWIPAWSTFRSGGPTPRPTYRTTRASSGSGSAWGVKDRPADQAAATRNGRFATPRPARLRTPEVSPAGVIGWPRGNGSRWPSRTHQKTFLRADLVHLASVSAELPAADFVAATVGRLPPGYPLDPTLADALRCLA